MSSGFMDRAKTIIENKGGDVVKPTPIPTSTPTKQPDPAIQPKITDTSNNGGGIAKVNIAVKSNSDEKLIEDEMNELKDNSKGKRDGPKRKDDEIYEGGEAEGEITEVFVDPDEEEEVDAKKTRIKYKEVPDWRLNSNFFAAFWKGGLRKNDYQIIFSQVM